ncbi:MAG: prepilin-type N-terminal cleavage/methylation domain-containing protein [Planctomycetes bacterium]|nr:prepilin-type N-terminal cleavage/methylation domain-containing protein [Planctomycetota bacterium]
MTRDRSRQAGFTIIEILIAVVVLSIGLVGILAVFPTAIKTGAKTTEDSYAGIIAQSVMAAVQVGVRENRGRLGGAGTPEFFVLQHEGVGQYIQVPTGESLATGTIQTHTIANKTALSSSGLNDFRKSCIIVLPPRPGASENSAFQNEVVWIFPNTQGFGSGSTSDQMEQPGRDLLTQGLQSTVQNAPTGMKNYNPHSDVSVPESRATRDDGSLKDYYVMATYPLGLDILRRQQGVRDILRDPTRPPPSRNEQKVLDDPFPQYSFALRVRRARIDSDNDRDVDTNDNFTELLYEFTVMIYRNFKPYPKKRENDPIKELSTLIAF